MNTNVTLGLGIDGTYFGFNPTILCKWRIIENLWTVLFIFLFKTEFNKHKLNPIILH